ncbi:DUF3006 domain-containing protein [Paenibacillus sp. XY044]|uniref:DUF3006 domain-containing protein n=1 Tax=Paenibacillus sp. XY044 TaxID=2026089 RepID=UPI000B994D79|nr:DUF3006 domain-containing protein [Paenibacillus sp. XY044]OZB94790.1 hypothetical protein CJP46_13735 [Paenibacillus sp. XY044]
MTGYVEGFDGPFCRIEVDGNIQAVPREQVDPRVKAGDAVERKGGIWVTDPAATKRRTDEIKKLMDDVWES